MVKVIMRLCKQLGELKYEFLDLEESEDETT